MRRFRFPLQRVVWYRGLRESLAQQALGLALRREHAVEDALARTRVQKAEGAARLAASLHRPMSGSDLALSARFAAGLAARADRLARERAEAAGAVAERRAALRDRWRDRESAAQLRRQAAARHRAAAEREAQGGLDEVAAVRHNRRATDPEG